MNIILHMGNRGVKRYSGSLMEEICLDDEIWMCILKTRQVSDTIQPDSNI